VGPDQPAEAVHQAGLERSLGRIFAVFMTLMVVEFWSSTATLAGQHPGGVAANLLLSVLLTGQALRAVARPPSQRGLGLMVVATGSLLLVSRALAVPGSPFLENIDALVMPVGTAWATWSARFLLPVPVLLVVLASWTWNPRADLAAELTVTSLAVIACASWTARLLRAGAQRADAEAEVLSRRMAAQDAALAAEEAERRAANAVHDDVLSVLRAVSLAGGSVAWSVVVAKARGAMNALARQVLRGGYGLEDLGSALRRQASEAAVGLNVRCDIDEDLDVPAPAVEALSAAAGEALRNAAAHSGVGRAVLTARGRPPGGVTVTIADDGIGFDPVRVDPARSGLRNSVRARLSDVSGHADIISAPGQGTSVVLTWGPPQPASAPATDPLAWARRMTPSPRLIFAGFMLPILLIGVASLSLRWPDMRWHAAAVGVFLAFTGVAALCARYLSQVRMTRAVAGALAAANAVLVAVGSLAVTPGTTDSYAYWVGTGGGIAVAAVYFLRGPVSGLIALALDLAALTAGLLVTGSGISAGVWVAILTSPVLGAGVAAAMLAAFRNVSGRTESRLAEYREQVRLHARAEAISRVDNAALENARRVAGPVLERAASGQPPDPALRMSAMLADATLRDGLLAPGFLTPALAERVRAARIAGVHVAVDVARLGDAVLPETARRLLAAAMVGLVAGDGVTLKVYPPAEGSPALLVLCVRGQQPDHAALRRCAEESGALVSDLGDHEFLIRLQSAADPAEESAAAPVTEPAT
jgi:signal transduction histidine kinase